MKSLFENLFGKKPPQAAKRIDHSSATPLQQPTFAPYKKGDLIGGKYYVHGVLGAGGFGIDELNPCLFAKFCCQTFSLRGGTPDLRSDLYAFGLVLWQMVTGSLMAPFVQPAGNDIGRLMQKTYENQISGRLPAVTHPLGSVIQRCLISVPADRYPTFGEMRRSLEVIFQNLTGRQITKAKNSNQTVSFWCNKGLSLVTLEQHEEAIACFDKALAIDPNDSMTWCNKGATFAKMERYELAMPCLDKAIAIDPKHPLAWCNKAGVLVELGRQEEALACYDRALTLEPRSTTAWNNKGRILNSLGSHDDAITCFDKVLTIDPKHSVALNNKAKTLATSGRHHEALAWYEAAIAIEPQDSLLWNNKGACLAAMARREDEIACYEKALQIEPEHAMAWFNKGSTEDEIGRIADAITSYSQFVRFAPPQYAEHVIAVRRRIAELQPKP